MRAILGVFRAEMAAGAGRWPKVSEGGEGKTRRRSGDCGDLKHTFEGDFC